MSESAKPSVAVPAICALILAGAALHLARTVFAPAAFALFVIAVVWPLQSRLERVVPKALALSASVLATLIVVTAFGSLTAWAFGRTVRYVVNDAPHLQAVYLQLSDWLETHGVVLAGLFAEHFDVRWLIRLLPEVASRISNMTAFLFVILIYVILGLSEVDEVARKLHTLDDHGIGRALLAGGAETAAKLRRFVVVRTLMSLTTGLLVCAFAAAMALPLALEWGVIAFTLNYIPVIGSAAATVLPTVFALAQFVSWEIALVVLVGLNLIQFFIGNFVEPKVAGSSLSISPVIVVFAVFLWTFLWGIAGAFIGVPITIAGLTICEQFPSSRWIAELLGSPKGTASRASP
ncbi:protein of unknown function UPF0118 [Methylobacterium sp. 4-46]|uniref:AI-2E family transporter n=1 Tax=unclassified Methylobacterium TaxID=2615210 RepID=UPI000152C474|nr:MULTISPECIES: AI-2E family transporter [Methylobacterium]ACA15347.1 protein of unknown function UPF0118 [Methylobacterium sp. 4-46]WFT81070.1 AI-2E family transporter [Methylobacterium nodulans]